MGQMTKDLCYGCSVAFVMSIFLGVGMHIADKENKAKIESELRKVEAIGKATGLTPAQISELKNQIETIGKGE